MKNRTLCLLYLPKLFQNGLTTNQHFLSYVDRNLTRLLNDDLDFTIKQWVAYGFTPTNCAYFYYRLNQTGMEVRHFLTLLECLINKS